MSCPDPPSVANGYISSQSASSVTYACNDEFGLSGYDTVLCSAGAWGTLPYCYTQWNRNNNNYIKTATLSSIPENLSEEIPDYIVYVVAGSVGAFVLALLAGLLLCWLHQIGCYDGPAVGFGGSYIYTDRRCCYFGDLNIKGCNFKCGLCRRRCCRYVRKKSHGKVHLQTMPTPEEIALQKWLMKKKKKRKFRPVPCCLRAGRCLLDCLLCCCRWKRKKAKLVKEAALAEEEKMMNIAAAPETKEEDTTIINVQTVEEEPEPGKEAKPEKKTEPFPPPAMEIQAPTKEPKKKPEPPLPPLMAIREPPPKPKKTEETPEPQKEKKNSEPVGKPLMTIKIPPKPKKKKAKALKGKQEKKNDITSPSDTGFIALVESTENPFGNNDITPSKRAREFQNQANGKVIMSSKAGKGNKVMPDLSVDSPRLTYEKAVKTKVAKWGDMNDDDLWKTQPQQKLFSPEAPIKTRKTEQMIPLVSFLQINEKPEKKKKSPVKKKMDDDEEEFGLPSAGKKSTNVRQF
ncbi:lysine-specific demethylase phf2-like [Pecten maximus]|uniref:lysine-specific demethylase phf2-like n=1 Tax=Pecten maximus TaxID=6579 RepID=UPI00145851C3|nr:lysine-specific demethylase phf2-like [Pecten maximus]